MSEDPELNRLLNGLLEGSLSPVETQRVRVLLQSSASARQDYYDLVAVEQLLAERYEMPDHIALQAQLMAKPELPGSLISFPSGRRRLTLWGGGAAAAAVALSCGAFFFMGSRQQPVSVVVSPDSHYEVNGYSGVSGILKSGDTIDVKHGAVSLSLTRHAEVTLEGPAKLKLGSRQGRVELLSGSAFFSVNAGGEGELEVTSPAGVIRDIGTKFGVTVHDGGDVETHVDEGRVEIERRSDDKSIVTAGYSAAWNTTGAVVSRKTSDYPYVRYLPGETALFLDGFNDAEGAPLKDRSPQIGSKWSEEDLLGPAKIRDGRLDTIGGDKTFSGGFRFPDENTRTAASGVYILTFKTRIPAGLQNHKPGHDAAENISLLDAAGQALFSLVARSSRDHRWQLKDGSSERLSYGTRISAFEEHTLTLTFDRRSKTVRLYDGATAQGTFVDELKLSGDGAPESISISNSAGGELAVDDVMVRMVTY